jgi:carbamoyltransferase
MKYILGISAYYHDSACCLIRNGEILNAAQEERFSRIKNDSAFPSKSIKWILNKNNLSLKDISAYVFYEKPFLKFERIIESYTALAPKGFRSFKAFIPEWITKKFF